MNCLAIVNLTSAPLALGHAAPSPTLPRALRKGGRRLRWRFNLPDDNVWKGQELATKPPPLRVARGRVGVGARARIAATANRALLIAVLLLSAMLSSLAFAENNKLPKIGELWYADPDIAKPWRDAFRQGLSELGYVEGRNILISQPNMTYRVDWSWH